MLGARPLYRRPLFEQSSVEMLDTAYLACAHSLPAHSHPAHPHPPTHTPAHPPRGGHAGQVQMSSEMLGKAYVVLHRRRAKILEVPPLHACSTPSFCSSPSPHLLHTASTPSPHLLLTASTPSAHLLRNTFSTPPPHLLHAGLLHHTPSPHRRCRRGKTLSRGPSSPPTHSNPARTNPYPPNPPRLHGRPREAPSPTHPHPQPQ